MFCNSFQDNLRLDLYLAPHVNTLYTQIRNRALIQVSAFSLCILLANTAFCDDRFI